MFDLFFNFTILGIFGCWIIWLGLFYIIFLRYRTSSEFIKASRSVGLLVKAHKDRQTDSALFRAYRLMPTIIYGLMALGLIFLLLNFLTIPRGAK